LQYRPFELRHSNLTFKRNPISIDYDIEKLAPTPLELCGDREKEREKEREREREKEREGVKDFIRVVFGMLSRCKQTYIEYESQSQWIEPQPLPKQSKIVIAR